MKKNSVFIVATLAIIYKYGFSKYDGGGENQLTISDYIEGHKN